MHEDDQLTTLAGHAAVLGGHRPVAAPSRKWTRGERVRGRRRMSCVARGTRPKSVFPLPCRGGVGLGDWGSRGGPRRPSCWSALAHAYPHPHPYQHRHTHDHTHTHTHTPSAPTRTRPHLYPHVHTHIHTPIPPTCVTHPTCSALTTASCATIATSPRPSGCWGWCSRRGRPARVGPA